MRTFFVVVVIQHLLAAIAAYRALPSSKLIVLYAPGCNSTKLIEEVRRGCNVLIWFSVSLKNGSFIEGGPNRSCVLEVQREVDAVHMISIGGWDAPHPEGNGTEWWSAFEAWNEGLYDGIDWDLEGNDDLGSPYNTMSFETLRLVNDMSVAARKAGAIVSIVPPQSYLDTSETTFSYSLENTYSDFVPEFTYRGRNTYAPLVAWFDYDFVDVQLYESWSRTGQALEQTGADPAHYLLDLVRSLTHDYFVGGFPPELGLGNETLNLSIPLDKLVLGFSRGSPTTPSQAPGKSPFISPSDVGRAWQMMGDHAPRGCMLWNANLDGGPCWLNDGTQLDSCEFVETWNKFLLQRNHALT